MAFLRTWRRGARRYYAVVRSERRRGKRYVVQCVLEYLGRDPDPVWRATALRYWQEKEKGGRT